MKSIRYIVVVIAAIFLIACGTANVVETASNDATSSRAGKNESIPFINNPIITHTSFIEHINTPSSDSTINNTTQLNSANELETAPTVTSVQHQVWTSSSSGSLDELSPEIISKLRQDVPFLAAYALRPRLVGGLPPASSASLQAPSSIMQTIYDNHSRSAATTNQLESAASAPKLSRQQQQQVGRVSDVVTRSLGDFSEFKVETSSTSKSEHHHQRRTSLKKQPTADQGKNTIKPSVSLSSSKLNRRSSVSGLSKKRQSRKSRKSNRRRSRNRRGRLGNRRLQRRGRFAEANDDKTIDSNELDNDQQKSSRGESGTKTKAPEVGDTKGGSRTNKKPFYAGAQVPRMESKPVGKENPSTSQTMGTNNTRASDDELAPDNELDMDYELDDEPEPKRVGDDDVEEDGDTVLVEPKSDGVDDDPPLPEVDDNGNEIEPNSREKPESTAETEREDGDTSKSDDADSSGLKPPESDPRAKRVNRERPNATGDKPPAPVGLGNDDDNSSVNDRDDIDDAQPGSGLGQAAGGGIGATIGGGGGGGGNDRKNDVSPGVEFASEGARGRKANGRDDDGDNPDADDGRSSPDDGSLENGGEVAGFGNRKSGSAGSATGSANGASGQDLGGVGRTMIENDNNNDDDEDLDYRDEIAAGRGRGDMSLGRKQGNSGDENFNRSGGKAAHDGASGDGTSKSGNPPPLSMMIPQAMSGSKVPGRGGGGGGDSDFGHDDGSYKPHDEKYHDEHHQTGDWLRGSIPGEPDDDYPILDRVTNRTNFKCSNQQSPGYYADVESRCQVSVVIIATNAVSFLILYTLLYSH